MRSTVAWHLLVVIATTLLGTVDSQSGCSANNIELVFAVDNTAISTGYIGWNQITNFMVGVVNQFNVGSNAVRVAFVWYSDSPTQQFSLNQYSDGNSVDSAISNANYYGRGTAN